uniref:Uncharacterized protein n=1 Tax=Candidatus Kentrum sp. MB TaxID=2138164 RepID=A0A450XKG2_9GAMM|nr:MAG: hypothetical protein BECKMB1821I_GA0114274_10125 [Candidatus Kentron sp. MB]VFK74947.1 MAG: hypothetical protein BECKMB1821H_GA0114242_10135 [Candidatus Kentron sp. MB]
MEKGRMLINVRRMFVTRRAMLVDNKKETHGYREAGASVRFT